MDFYRWDHEKNERLKKERGVSFEQVVMHIEQGDLLGVYDHPNKVRYPGQQVLVVKIEKYVYLVPFFEAQEGKFLKTIIPSRKATREFLGEADEETES